MNNECKQRFSPAVQRIQSLCEQSTKEILLVGIDGMSAGGKTTLGYYLKEQFNCNLFHMDDFFLQPYQRTSERLNEPGGNVDYERFKSEVLDRILMGQKVIYRPYDCKEQRIHESVEIPKARLNVVEGSYSLHPFFGDAYDLRFYTEISGEMQKERILRRNGEKMWKRFQNEWIPMENSYEKTFFIKKEAIVLKLTEK